MILAITACSTGIAHTYMAAECLEQAARRRGVPIKVETQGALGVENRHTLRDIREAWLVLLAADVEIQEPERLSRKRIVRVPVLEAIEDPEGLLSRCLPFCPTAGPLSCVHPAGSGSTSWLKHG